MFIEMDRFFFFFNFIYLFLATLGLRCCMGGLLKWASHGGGFSCCGARALGLRASVVVAHKLSSCGSLALEHRFDS